MPQAWRNRRLKRPASVDPQRRAIDAVLRSALAGNTSPSRAASGGTRAAAGARQPRRPEPDRGPLELIPGGADHAVPWAITNASFAEQRSNPGVTAIEEVPGRGSGV